MMTPEDVRSLLGEIAVIDNRKLSTETAQTWHTYLHGFTLSQCRDALATHRRNAPDVWVTPGHLVAIIRRHQATANSTPRCEHGITRGDYCHDCSHPSSCTQCRPKQADPEGLPF